MNRPDIIRGMTLAAFSLAAAVNAHGSTVVLPTAGFTCQYTEVTITGSANCGAGIGAVAQLGAGGLSYSISTGGIDLFGNASLQEGTFGQVATAIPVGTSIGYSYDIFLTETLTDPNWSLGITIFDGGLGVIATTGSIGGTYGTTRTEFAGSGTMTTTQATNPNDILTVEYLLNLTGVTGGGNPFTTVEVPAGGSVDIQTISTPSTPEPGSLALLAGGLAWLGWKLRRRHLR